MTSKSILRTIYVALAAVAFGRAMPTSVDATALREAPIRTERSADYRLFPQPIGHQIAIPDASVNLAIDSRLPPVERNFIRQTLLRIPPSYRSNVVYLTADGILHANKIALLNEFRVDRSNAISISPKRVSSKSSDDGLGRSHFIAPLDCSPRSISGEKTGEFRRVIVECTGYTSQTIGFSNPVCSIGQYAQFSGDSVYILGGAYTTDGSSGIDTGLQYSIANNGYKGFLAGSIGGVVTGTNGTLPCGGLYQVATTITSNPNNPAQNTFVLNDSYTDQSGNNPMLITLMGDVLASTFALNASNWVARRCTCLAQKSFNDSDASWFGFSRNIAGNGPNLSKPQMEYTSFIISNAANPIGMQVSSSTATADRNPPDENNIVLCGHDPSWLATNFNTYEGFNLGNPNATGTYSQTVCTDSK